MTQKSRNLLMHTKERLILGQVLILTDISASTGRNDFIFDIWLQI
jgi:hypothetical protein